MAKSSNIKDLMEKYKSGDISGGIVHRTLAVGENGGGIGGDPSQLKTAAVNENGGGAWGPPNLQTKPTPRRKDSKYGDQSPFFKGNPPPPPSMRTPPGSQQMPGTKQPFPTPNQQPFPTPTKQAFPTPTKQAFPTPTKQAFPTPNQQPFPGSQPMPGADNPRRPMPGFAPPKAPPGGQQMKTMAMIASEMGGGMPGPIQSQGPGTGLAPGGQNQPFGYMPERFRQPQQIQPPTREQQEQAARDPMNQYNRAMMEYMDKNPNATQEEAQKFEDQQRAKYGISEQDTMVRTLAIPEGGGGQPGPIQSQGPGTGLAPNKQIDLSQLMQPPRDRSQIIEDRVREQTIMDSPPGSPQRKHLEAGGKVTDMPKPDGTPERDVQPGGYPVGGPTRDGSPGFLEPDPKNPHGSKQAEVKHNIEVERQKEAELGNKPTADIAPGMEKYADKHKPNSTQTQPAQQSPSFAEEPKQEPTETDTPGPVKTEQPTPVVDTTPTDTRTTPQQRDAAQKFKDKRQERITGKKSMPFG